jgi:nucleoside-diphosphate-sugar epimerase
MQNVMITGIAGFIGSNLADYLLERGYNVFGIDDLSYGVKEQIPTKAKFTQIDIRSKDIADVLGGMDSIFHFAAKNCIPDCQLDPVDTFDINVMGTINLFEACKKVGLKRMIYAESSAIYEGSKVFPTKEKDEYPESFYAISKYSEKYIAEAYQRFHRFNITALRYFNVYGPRQDYRRSIPPLMSAIILNLLSNKSPTIYGDGSKRRDFIYVDDINRFHKMIIHDERTFGNTYNLGMGVNYSVIEIYKIIDDIIGSGMEPSFKEDQLGEALQNLADISQAKELGWKPEIKIEAGLKMMIEYIKHDIESIGSSGR